MELGKTPQSIGAFRNLADGTLIRLHPFRVNSIGRASHADVRLGGKEFSRIHAVVYWDGKAWSLIDCSSNGTTVNGRSVTKHPLQIGDRIRFGVGSDWTYEEIEAAAEVGKTVTTWGGTDTVRIEPGGCLSETAFVGESLDTVRLRREIRTLAEGTANTLLIGEFGVGKRQLAQTLHVSGKGRHRAFVTVACGGLTRQDVRSTLSSLCDPATTSDALPPPATILLQRVNELDPGIQEELLDMLESVSVLYRHGQEALSRPRFVSTAETDPQVTGQLLEPLMNRLFVAQYQIRPLRERREEIPTLAGHFARQFSAHVGRRVPRFSSGFLGKLEQYHWPANVAELRNVVERTVMLGQTDNLEVWDLSSGIAAQAPAESVYSGLSLSDVEGKHIEMTLRAVRWKKSQAAKVLGIERSTLDRKIEKYGIRRENLRIE